MVTWAVCRMGANGEVCHVTSRDTFHSAMLFVRRHNSVRPRKWWEEYWIEPHGGEFL
jgi:hypothetical protein